jgi:hypothetical protein
MATLSPNLEFMDLHPFNTNLQPWRQKEKKQRLDFTMNNVKTGEMGICNDHGT